MAYNLSLLSWSSASIPFTGAAGTSARKTMLLTLTVKNNAGKTTPAKFITIVKN
jgi:hypothetical protein